MRILMKVMAVKSVDIVCSEMPIVNKEEVLKKFMWYLNILETVDLPKRTITCDQIDQCLRVIDEVGSLINFWRNEQVVSGDFFKKEVLKSLSDYNDYFDRIDLDAFEKFVKIYGSMHEFKNIKRVVIAYILQKIIEASLIMNFSLKKLLFRVAIMLSNIKRIERNEKIQGDEVIMSLSALWITVHILGKLPTIEEGESFEEYRLSVNVARLAFRKLEELGAS